MRAKEVTATEAARSLGDLLARVRYRGETFLIRRGRKVVAWLGPVPVEPVAGPILAERLRSRRRLAPAEAEAFARDVESARRSVNKPPGEPWES